MQPWLDKIHERGLSSIERMDIVGICKRHRAESVIIPEGKRQGWPMKLNKTKLEERAVRDHVWSRIVHLTREPEGSLHFEKLKERHLQKGKKASSGVLQFEQMEGEQAGYYGQIGWALFFKIIMRDLCNTADRTKNVFANDSELNSRIAPLTPNQFITGVMIPELCSLLIAQDLQAAGKPCSLADADVLRLKSIAYGNAMFPLRDNSESASDSDADCDKGKSMASQRRKKEAEGAPAAAPASMRTTRTTVNGAQQAIKSKRRVSRHLSDSTSSDEA
ncbi:hypothetical protein K437DRAFT_265723 [Tilletiaria anomala UBC 951]|uniref:Restriction of telomere capping protein 4 n=1 Tax=Tilletiaria anomala (strain ATCC 24038 / CBS 436.72 / UBC 951) TaxID=1037660 RepID=A0A066WLB8_TILAU|nr:uncharacterized protein K437DRAFT_265723 [Tilletiaria anomala UBC 951]KDN53353.1 hypothetical protein K437DRAFT_265723 [Tilletiaria anomala UBC 951]